VILIRLLLFISFFYVGYFILKKLIINPFRNGYQRKQEHDKTSTRKNEEGEVSVSFDPAKQGGKASAAGEYIDYEEVRDEDEKK
jgi:hypothetical protein